MLEWFMTVPGLLISSGVVLLIVAIVLFVLDNKSAKKGTSVKAVTDKVEVSAVQEKKEEKEEIKIPTVDEVPVEVTEEMDYSFDEDKKTVCEPAEGEIDIEELN